MYLKYQRTFLLLTLIFVVTIVRDDIAQNRYFIGIGGNYTTSAKMYLTPNSIDPVIRNNFIYYDDIFSPSLEAGMFVRDNLILKIELEYQDVLFNDRKLIVLGAGGTREIPVEEGYQTYIMELSTLYVLPVRMGKFSFGMGGGISYYIGKFVRKIGEISASPKTRKPAYGIQAMLTVDYEVKSNFLVQFSFKFRDPLFRTINEYNKTSTVYKGEIIQVGNKEFETKVNIDGVTFYLGGRLYFTI